MNSTDRPDQRQAKTAKPSGLPVLHANIPAKLKTLQRWVTWRYVPETDQETGEVSWDKPPRNARTDQLASSTDPRTWSSFGEAIAAYQRGGLDGVGFVIHKEKGDTTDGLVGI